MSDRPTARWWVVIQSAAALAASMGVGRFVYTPILPLMHRHAGLSASAGANLATLNYLGYLAGALATIIAPVLIHSRAALRVSLLALVVTLALMPATQSQAAWAVLRLIAGVASAMVFVIAVNALMTQLRGQPHHLTGWGFGGVGAGIAASGGLVLAAGGTWGWRGSWWLAAALAALLTVPSWTMWTGTSSATVSSTRPRATPAPARWFFPLLASYSLEGVGYIIAGTFLVAAIDENGPTWAGDSAWIIVGLAALPASAVWAILGRYWSRPTLLAGAAVLQAIGIALPAVSSAFAASLISAMLFGFTFLGIASLALAIGAHLQYGKAVAVLTTGYSLGQVAGPLITKPLLHNGYHDALLLAAVIVLAAAASAAVVRRQFPDTVGTMVEPSRIRNSVCAER